MIYLIRGSEIAVLECPDDLDRYQAHGYRVVTWPAFLAAWRANTDALMERLIAAAWMRQPGCALAPDRDVCRYCRMGPIVRPRGCTPWCRTCSRPQVDDAKQR